MISEIEEELKRISPWPWKHKLNDAKGKTATFIRRLWELGSSDSKGIAFVFGDDVNDATFIAQSPERIALLVEYVKAAEGKMKADHDYRIGEISIYGFQAKLDVYLAARRKLGLEE